MAASSFFATIAVLSLAATGALGWYAQRVHGQLEGTAQQASSVRAQLDDANRSARDAEQRYSLCSQARDADNARTAADLDASRAELDQIRKERADVEKRLGELNEKFKKMIDSGKLQIVMRHGRMTVKLPAEILFASGSADLSNEGKAALKEVATVLKQMRDRKFMVAGHTDNVPVVPPSPFKNNWELSTARAVTVLGELVSAGMNAAKLTAAGYSEYEPVQSNGSEAGRRENRRIEIVLLPNLAEVAPMTAQNTPAPAPKPGPHP